MAVEADTADRARGSRQRSGCTGASARASDGGQLGQPVVVENRPGAGGIVGIEALARSAADGYTVAIATQSQLVFNPHLFRKLPYDPQRDVAPIARRAAVAMVVAVNPSHSATTLAELIAQARSEPGRLRYAVPPPGTPPHVLALRVARAAGIELTAVPFKGSAEAISGAISGQVPLVVEAPPVVAQHVRAGRLRALAVTGSEREPLLPQTPTVAELGLPEATADTWLGLAAPSGTDPATTTRLHQAARAAIAADEMQAVLRNFGWRPIESSPAEFAAAIRSDTERWGPLITEAGLKLD